MKTTLTGHTKSDGGGICDEISQSITGWYTITGIKRLIGYLLKQALAGKLLCQALAGLARMNT